MPPRDWPAERARLPGGHAIQLLAAAAGGRRGGAGARRRGPRDGFRPPGQTARERRQAGAARLRRGSLAGGQRSAGASPFAVVVSSDQSDAGSASIFSLQTNHTRAAVT
eukprot:1194705-Prorocentrum_minimum.AAC.4